MPEPESSIQTIFAEALEFRDPDARSAFLARACRNNTALRAELEGLLAAAAQAAGSFLPDQPSVGPTTEVSGPERAARSVRGRNARPGDRIGPYRLMERIGEGGCGVVYLAEQEEPLRRQVALKIIKLGMDTEQVIARFEAERQALALMDHPNIAKVLDAGATETGRPYFVMELAGRARITDYCDTHQLSVPQRLELFIQVCQAVQHAHQKGVIHRDIKPSNVLISLQDGKPQPKVIDFGIAKATLDQRLTDKTLYTAIEQFVGTPAYMSPEQVSLSNRDVDTRTDIYSLGVLLYELLTRTAPFESKDLLRSGFDEMRRIIRDAEPQRPSARLKLARSDESTRTATPSFHSQLDPDLDWIVMKALEKDRRRRYDTAAGLAADVRHFLLHEPVTAVAHSLGYSVRKFVRRHRVPVAVTATILFLLTAGAVTSTRLAYEAASARNKEAQANKALKQQISQTEEAKEAERQQRLRIQDAFERMEIQRAEELLTANNAAAAVAYLANTVRRNPANRVAVERLVSTLTDRNFALPVLAPFSHQARMHAVQFSPDGQRAATGAEDGLVRIWDTRSGSALVEIKHAAAVNCVQFSPAGERILTCSSNLVQIWNAQDGSAAMSPIRTVNLVWWADFSPDGERIVTAASEARVWNARTAEPISPPFEEDDPMMDWAVFNPKGERVVTGSMGNAFRIWDAATGKPVTGLLGREFDPRIFVARRPSAQFAPDGRRLVTAGPGKSATIWDVNSGEALRVLKHRDLVTDATFSPDGHKVLTASADKTAQLWNADSGEALSDPLIHDDRVASARFSRDGIKLITTGFDQSVRVWDADTGQLLIEPIRPHTFIPQMVEMVEANPIPAQLNPDATMAIVLVSERSAQIWDIRSSQSLPLILQYESPLTSVEISRNGRRALAFAPSEGKAHLWDLPEGSLPVLITNLGRAYSGQFSQDGLRIVVGGLDKTARLWDAETGQALSDPLPHQKLVFEAELNQSGERLITSGAELATIWDLTAQPPTKLVLQHASLVTSSHFSPDGKQVVTSSFDKKVQIWDAGTGKASIDPIKHTESVISAQFSPDGHRILSACGDGTARIWDAKTGSALVVLPHAAEVNAASFSPNGEWVITASADRTARVWDSTNGRPMTEPLRHGAGVTCAEFSPDGQRIATGSLDKTARIWDAHTGQALTDPIRHEEGVVLARFSADGRKLYTRAGTTMSIFDLGHLNLGPVPSWLPEMAEALVGRRYNESVLEAVPSVKLFEQKEARGRDPATNTYSHWARWLLSDRVQRPVSSSSSLLLPQYVAALIQENTAHSLQRAIHLSPTNAVALARLARRLIDDQPDEEARLPFTPDSLIGRAKEQAPDEPEVYWASAAWLEKQGKRPEALQAMEAASERHIAVPDFWLTQGKLLEAAGEKEKALFSYTRAVDLTAASAGTSSETRVETLLKRSNLLNVLGRRADSQKDLEAYLQGKSIPLRAPGAVSKLIDLSRYYNAPLSSRKALAAVPTGVQTLSGIDFDVRGLIEVGVASSRREHYSKQVTGIEIGQACRGLEFLHAADNAPLEPDGNEVGQYLVHYADGKETKIPIIMGEDIAIYWSLPWEKPRPKPVVAWSDVSEGAGGKPRTIRLFKSTWANPRPTETIRSVDFVSTKSPVVLLLVAVTAE